MASGKTNIGLMYGLISAGVGIVFTLVLYLMGAEWFIHPIAFSGLVIAIVIGVLAGLAQKKANGGYLEFSEALRVVYTVFIVSSLVSTIFMYVLLNYIDEPFRQALAQKTAESTEAWMKRFGAPQDQIDKATTDALNANNYSPKSMALGFAFWAIAWFIIALIVAAIIKRKKPEF
jgi:disulfide bond formation protein DsbB